jgi:pyruvate dehydrogenase E2 component (dihydrolipoamide acetyltransferase)
MAGRLEVHLPDIGDFHDVDVVEVLVSVGQRVEKEQSLIVLESDKATMEVPSPAAGVVETLRVGVGDQVSEGDLIAVLRTEGAETVAPEPGAAKPQGAAAKPQPAAAKPQPAAKAPEEPAAAPAAAPPARAAAPAPTASDAGAAPEAEEEPEPRAARAPRAHASPSVRRLARELGVDLARVPGTARKGRITREDVQKFVKASLSQGGAAGVPLAGVAVAAPVDVDFSKWGETELQPLNRVRRLSASNLHRSWVTVPHVTQFDEADITELDAFRATQKEEAKRRGVKLTFLPFVVKAVTAALREFPHFNASLDRTGESLIVKKYFHVGVAVDTENGLVVPVIRDADRKGLFELAGELEDLSTRARGRKLKPGELQGGSFSISSLGGIGGTFFTPIVNHPEVAILGVSRMQWKPVWQDGAFVPRLILPLSLSYDHRVIDGADAVRFTRRLTELVGDLRLLLL